MSEANEPRVAAKPWVHRNRAEDLAHEHRQLEERIDYELSSPGYLAELTELVEAEKARTVPYRETMDSALGYAPTKPSRSMLPWEARRGLRNEEEDMR